MTTEQPITTETPVPIKVWDLPTRVFHWSLALSFTGAFVTSEGEHWRVLHVMFGVTLIGLILFRLIWGVAGTRYARFASFVAGPGKVINYLRSLMQGQPEHHVGHNPAGALAIIALLGGGLLTGTLGLLAYNDIGPDWIGDVHEVAANIMVGIVFIHLAGVVVSSFLHRENLVRSMLSGYKRGRLADGISGMRWVIGVILLAAVLGFWGTYVWTEVTPQGLTQLIHQAGQGGGEENERD